MSCVRVWNRKNHSNPLLSKLRDLPRRVCYESVIVSCVLVRNGKKTIQIPCSANYAICRTACVTTLLLCGACVCGTEKKSSSFKRADCSNELTWQRCKLRTGWKCLGSWIGRGAREWGPAWTVVMWRHLTVSRWRHVPVCWTPIRTKHKTLSRQNMSNISANLMVLI